MLEVRFWILIFNVAVGEFCDSSVIAFGIIGALMVKKDSSSENLYDEPVIEDETYKDIGIRTAKVFIFIIALELLGDGFKPFIDIYVINLNNMASTEISSKMTPVQIKAILLGLLIRGGMMIPGNMPNIISASKLKITSKENTIKAIDVMKILELNKTTFYKLINQYKDRN